MVDLAYLEALNPGGQPRFGTEEVFMVIPALIPPCKCFSSYMSKKILAGPREQTGTT